MSFFFSLFGTKSTTQEGSDLTDEQLEEYRMLSSFELKEIIRLRREFLRITEGSNRITMKTFFKIPCIAVNPLRDRISLIFGFPSIELPPEITTEGSEEGKEGNEMDKGEEGTKETDVNPADGVSKGADDKDEVTLSRPMSPNHDDHSLPIPPPLPSEKPPKPPQPSEMKAEGKGEGNAEGKGEEMTDKKETESPVVNPAQLAAEKARTIAAKALASDTAGNNNKSNGFFVYRWSDGDSYAGEYNVITGEKEGHGVMTFANSMDQKDEAKTTVLHRYEVGDVYEGEYKSNLRTGYGVHRKADGSIVYEGYWQNGAPASQVAAAKARTIAAKALASDIAGNNNKSNGFFVYRWSDGDTYAGEYNVITGEKEGHGVMTFANSMDQKDEAKTTVLHRYEVGDVYEGEYKSNLRTGYGVHRKAEGSVVREGYWQNGAPASPPTDSIIPDGKDINNKDPSPKNPLVNSKDAKQAAIDEAKALEEAKALDERMEASSIDFPTFLKGVAGFNTPGKFEEKLRVAFRIHDFDGDDMISREDMKQYLKLVTDSFHEDEMEQTIEELFHECASDMRKQNITFVDFQRVMAPTDFHVKLRLHI